MQYTMTWFTTWDLQQNTNKCDIQHIGAYNSWVTHIEGLDIEVSLLLIPRWIRISSEHLSPFQKHEKWESAALMSQLVLGMAIVFIKKDISPG